MNRADTLNGATFDTPIVLMNFINIYKKHKREDTSKEHLYCFYEGKDDNKYWTFLKNLDCFTLFAMTNTVMTRFYKNQSNLK